VKEKSKILIIDDEEVVLDSCTRILGVKDYRITTVTDGTKGLEMVRELVPDLVFVDLKMPGISGFEVLERIQKVDPTIVTIVITGYATLTSAIEAMKKGAYDFLPKPFTPEEFRLITRRGLEKRNLVVEAINLRREREILRENFAAIVSHELKSPLSAVQQNLFVLIHELGGKIEAEQMERLERMKVRINDLLQLIRTWHRGISVDRDKIRESFRPMEVFLPVTKAVESVQTHATRKNVEIVNSVPDEGGFVRGDEGTLTEAMVNLLDNAIKYSHDGGKVFVHSENRDEKVVLSVADTGIGIGAEELPFVLEGFYRTRTGAAAAKGTGFGLAVTRRIIEAHDGSITATSAPGKGSTFVISLPIMKNESGHRTPTDPASLHHSPEGGSG
jgi:signal transduction histidine kinase